jgi:hypothetical protein
LPELYSQEEIEQNLNVDDKLINEDKFSDLNPEETLRF